MADVTLADMPSKKKNGGQSKEKPVDRHESGFMVRLPEVFRAQLDKYRDGQYRLHRYRPPYTVIIQNALEEFLSKSKLWPPEEDE
jgi:hypothetical protein